MCATDCGGTNPSQQIRYEWGVQTGTWDLNESHGFTVNLPYGYRLVSVLPTDINSGLFEDTTITSFRVVTWSERLINSNYVDLDPKQSVLEISVKRTSTGGSQPMANLVMILEKGCTPVAVHQYNSEV